MDLYECFLFFSLADAKSSKTLILLIQSPDGIYFGSLPGQIYKARHSPMLQRSLPSPTMGHPSDYGAEQGYILEPKELSHDHRHQRLQQFDYGAR